MRLPERVKVGPYEYAVALVDEARNGEHQLCAGTCDFIAHRIEVHREMPPDRHRETFIHEALHAIDDMQRTGLTEKQVHRLAVGLTAFLVDNGLLREDRGDE
jgi:hypothetical protein